METIRIRSVEEINERGSTAAGISGTDSHFNISKNKLNSEVAGKTNEVRYCDFIGEGLYGKQELDLNKEVFQEIKETLAAKKEFAKCESPKYPCLDNFIKYLPFCGFEKPIPWFQGNPRKFVMHIELNDFPFCALYKDDQSLRNKKLILLDEPSSWNSDSVARKDESIRIACVSHEARLAGIKPGMTYSEARRISEDVCVPVCDFTKTYSICLKFFKAISHFTSEFEASNCDEAFINVTKLIQEVAVNASHDMLSHIVFTLQHHINVITHATATIGIGSTRHLARFATRQARQRRQYYYYLDDSFAEKFISQQMDRLPLTRTE